MIKIKIEDMFKRTNIFIELILSILLSANILNVLYNYKYKGETNFIEIILIIAVAILILTIIIYNIIKNKGKLEIYFLIFMIPIGIMYQIFLMPNYVPDELMHMYKAYDVSQGNIITKIDKDGESKIEVPFILATGFNTEHDNYTDLENTANSKTNYNVVIETYTSAQSYSPILYIFSSLGFFIGRIFNLNIVLAVYLARLFNFIAFLVIGYLIIKLMPFGKLLMLTYLFNPMLIHQAMSISADSITNSSILLFIAYTLNILYKEEKLSKKSKVIYMILAIIVAISKNVYFPIVGLALLLFNKKKIEEKNDKIFIIAVLIIGFVSAVLWYLFGTLYKDVYVDIMQMGYNPSEQIKSIISNPFNFFIVMIRTIATSFVYYLLTFVGNNMGWLNIVSHTKIQFLIYGILIILAPFFEKNEKSFNKWQRVFVIFVTLVIGLMILLGFFINSTPVGESEILGIQGRYFIPIAILPLLCLVVKNKYINIKFVKEMYLSLLCAINLVQILTILEFLLR